MAIEQEDQTIANEPMTPAKFDLQGEDSRRLAAYWKDQLDHVKDEWKKWEKRGRTIEKRYRDERARSDAYGEEGMRRYASLWCNVQTLLPTLYGRVPVPIAERRFKDKDPVGRGAASILERALRNEIEINGYDEAVGQSVLDYLLPGRGAVWARYEPEMSESLSLPTESDMDMRDARGQIDPEDESETEEKLSQTSERVIRESVPIDYVPWGDFFIFPAKARTWKEVVAIGKRAYPSRNQLKRRFGDEVGKAIPLQKEDRDARHQRESVVPDDQADSTAEVYEIWSRVDERVYWVAEGYEFLCDRRDDPLQLEEFFPVPRPLFANPTNNTLVPVADYMQYQDQALQIDELTNRISLLTKACKVTGTYNAASKDIQRMLDETVENELIPVDNWAAFGEKGGVAGQFSFMPLKEIIGVINELDAQLDKTMAKMDRLTGITDVMRGTGDARETMGGQRLKSNSAGTRNSRRQAEVSRYCRDIVRIIADIMCKHFSPQSLIEASGALYEEGLGDIQMPPLSALQGDPQQVTAPQLQPPRRLPPPPEPVGVSGPPVPPTLPMGGVAPAPAPGAGPAPPVEPAPAGLQGNVVPFRGPQQPMPPQGPPGMPPGMGMPPQPQGPPPISPELAAKIEALKRIAASIQLLRNDKLRGFRVDIEVDSTVYGDAQQEKADRVEFISAVTKFLETALQIGAQMPEMVPLLGKLLQFGVRGFRVGRDLESAIEEFCDQAEESAKKRMANAEQNKGQNPEALKIQVEQMKAQAAMAQITHKSAADQAKAQVDAQQTQLKVQSDQAQAAAEVQRQQLENEGEAHNAQMDLQAKQADVEMRKMEMEIEKIRLQIELAKLQAAREQAQSLTTMPGAA